MESFLDCFGEKDMYYTNDFGMLVTLFWVVFSGAVLLVLWTACRFGYAMLKLKLQGLKRPWRQVLLENLPF